MQSARLRCMRTERTVTGLGLGLRPSLTTASGQLFGSMRGAWHEARATPNRAGARVPVAGGCDVGIARNLRRMPLWIFHGEKDDVVKPDASRAIAKALEKMKAPVKYTEYPGEGHGVIGKVIADEALQTWLFEQKRGK